MRIRELPLAEPIVTHFESAGIDDLYPPQTATVEAGICAGTNVMAAIPTASGKTLIAQLAMLTADGPGLYIVPLRALAAEKYDTFRELPGLDVGISTGDYDSTAAELAAYDIVVATSEKVDSAIRNGADWVDQFGCVVVDEIHLLGETNRGPTLEVTLANLRRLTPGVQLVALSATVDNPEEIADWLDATLVESTWRPVDLRTGVYADGVIEYDDGTTEQVAVVDDELPASADRETEATVELVDGAADAGGQCLCFVRSRREAESMADRLARETREAGFAGDVADDADAEVDSKSDAEVGGESKANTDSESDADTDMGATADSNGADDADNSQTRRTRIADEIEALDGTLTGRRLADCVRRGVGFHHAGLRSGHRALVETAFRNRTLSVIAATPTLAAGVNVPARRVVVRDQQRYTGSAMEWLPVLEIHQMCGRAGRPHLDPYGEAVLVGDETTKDALKERYLGADPEAVESKLASEAALRTHALSIIATGFADTEQGILDVLSATFYAHQTPSGDLSGIVSSVVVDLVEMGMIVRAPDSTLQATDRGSTVSKQYITPETGIRIVKGLERVDEMAAPTALTALEIICDTPDMYDTDLGNRERAAMYEYARRHADEFTTKMGETEEFERWLEAVKTARILLEWSDGATIEQLVEQYRLGPGDLDSRVERAEWLLGAADALADERGMRFDAIRQVREKL